MTRGRRRRGRAPAARSTAYTAAPLRGVRTPFIAPPDVPAGSDRGHTLGEIVGELFGAMRIGRLDHDPDQLFGPARAQQDSAVVAEGALGLGHRLANLRRGGDRGFVGD